MGRFIVTNNRDFFKKASNWIDKTGFNLSFSCKNENFYYGAYHKKSIKNTNYKIDNEKNFIIGIGTYFYNEKYGEKALEEIKMAISCQKINIIQKQIHGHFAIINNDEESVKIFGDAYNLYDIYYYYKNDFWIISNSLSTIVKSIDNKTVLLNQLLEKIFQIGNIGKSTFYKEIYRLTNGNYIKIKKDTLTFHLQEIKRLNKNINNLSYIECINKGMGKIKNSFYPLTNFEKKIGIEMTAGYDSRTIMASLNNQNIKGYSFLYGDGNKQVVENEESDLEVVKKLSNKYNKKAIVEDWSQSLRFNLNKLKINFYKNEFNYHIYGCNENYFNTYSKINEHEIDILLNGYCGEAMKERNWLLMQKKENLKILNIVKNYHITNINRHLFNNKNIWYNYIDYIYKNLVYQSQQNGVLVNNNMSIHKTEFNKFRQIIARSTGNVILNFENDYLYSYSPLFDFNFYEFAIYLPLKYRMHNKYQRSLIDNLDSDALNLEIFSHSHKVHKLTIYKKFKKSDFGKMFKYNILKLIGKRESDNISNEYLDYLRNTFWSKYLNFDILDISFIFLLRLTHFTIGIYELGFDNIEENGN